MVFAWSSCLDEEEFVTREYLAVSSQSPVHLAGMRQMRVTPGPQNQAGTVQMRVTPGPQNQAQRTQSVSPIGLVVNGLHCAASHTHTRLLSGVTLTCQLLNHARFGAWF